MTPTLSDMNQQHPWRARTDEEMDELIHRSYLIKLRKQVEREHITMPPSGVRRLRPAPTTHLRAMQGVS